jgi:ribosomal protein S18 acetylase RimI-like enzyme
MSRTDSHAPPGWPAVIPRLAVAEPEKLVNFMRQVFGAEGIYNEERPSEMKIGESIVLVGGTLQREPTASFLDEFPPLRRTVSEISSASSQFFGICDEARLFAVCEVSINGDNCWEIVSFGVEPSSLRQGYGSMLLRHLISRAGVVALSVSTASANAPGIKFYEKHGFACGDEWLTPERIVMVRLARSATLSDSGTQ